MDRIIFEALVDKHLVDALPHLRPLLGQRVELTAKLASVAEAYPKISFDEFLARRPQRPAGARRCTLEEMERSVIEGATDGDL